MTTKIIISRQGHSDEEVKQEIKKVLDILRERKSMNKINTNRVDYTKMSIQKDTLARIREDLNLRLGQAAIDYCKKDVASVQSAIYTHIIGVPVPPAITNVIFNDPATIVFWRDGTKTVVKAHGDDEFDPEKGLTMAITKKLFGNKGSYYNEIRKWLPKEELDNESKYDIQKCFSKLAKDANEALNEFLNRTNKKVEDKPSLESRMFNSVSRENKALKEELESLKEEKRHMQAEIEYLKKSKEILTSVNFVEKER